VQRLLLSPCVRLPDGLSVVQSQLEESIDYMVNEIHTNFKRE